MSRPATWTASNSARIMEILTGIQKAGDDADVVTHENAIAHSPRAIFASVTEGSSHESCMGRSGPTMLLPMAHRLRFIHAQGAGSSGARIESADYRAAAT